MGARAEELRYLLEEEILSGKLNPGDRLEEVALGARMGVSRTPVREALHLLAASGLVEIRPRRGAVVARIGPRQLMEMFDVMAELEAMCARLAARDMTAAELDGLRAAHDNCAGAASRGNSDDYYFENEHFHEAVRVASHNTFLAEQTRVLHKRLSPYRRYQLRLPKRVESSLAEHQAIVDALSDGSAEAAEMAMRGHISIQGERFADLVSSVEKLGLADACRA